jgi:type I site-specific restriction endonuclease
MESYLSAEDKARVEIDKMLEAAGWAVQDARDVNLAASRGVAVREFILEPPHGRADYLLFVDREAVGSSRRSRRAPRSPASSGSRRSTSTACPTG